MSITHCRVSLAVCAALLPLLAAAAPDTRSTLADQKSVSVTIYNQDLALVRDVRRLALPAGEFSLALRDVSAKMRPETALLRSLTAASSLRTLEQNFDFDLLTPEALLQKYVGRTVRIVTTHPTTGAETVKTAEVLSAAQGVVLRIGDRIETGIPGRIVYDELPANLRDRPTLSVQLANQEATTHDVEMSYLTGGLSWKADYVATLNGADDKLALNGWVTLTNQSGTSYRNAKLQLVAGDLNRVRDPRLEAKLMRMAAAPVSEAMADKMEREQLFEYHLYKLPRPTTIAENQTKQVALLSAPTVSVRKELVLQGNDYYYRAHHGELGQKMKVGIYVELVNRRADGLGLPLPAGVMRVYKADSAGQAIFVGEDRIEHTPENEKIRLKLGDAFDVTANKVQTDFKSLGRSGRYLYAFESAYRITLKNAKPEAATVLVQEPIPGDWEILAASHKHTKRAANTAVWEVSIPAKGEVELTYRVRTRW